MFNVNKGYYSSELLGDMMGLARAKLLLNSNINEEKHSCTAMLVILDVLITIDYEPSQESARKLQIEMVSSHMRTVFSIPDLFELWCSTYPSEPFIAEAASRQMYHYTKQRDFSMAGLLKKTFDFGLVNLRQKGEMVMRLLLREAYMNAIVAEQKGEEEDASPNFSKGCSFRGFLKALFAEEFHASVLECKPDNKVASPRTLKDAFKGAVVRFTHFMKAADGSAMTTKGMIMGFLRGAAIVGSRRQDIHIAIPILLDKDHAIEEASMTGLLIHIKRRQTENVYLMEHTALDFFPVEDARPYVTLVTELGVEPPFRSTSRVASDVETTVSNEHPRYSIRVYECTHRAWKVILPDEHTYYADMLPADDVLGDHQRQDATSLQLVRQQLPFWYGNASWFSDGESNNTPEFDSGRHEPVEVGFYDMQLELEESGGPEGMVVDTSM